MAPRAAAATEAVAGQPWYELDSTCIFCQKDDYACEYGPRSLLLCSCCPKGTHVECYEKAKGIKLTKDFIDSGSSWFCGKVRAGCNNMAQAQWKVVFCLCVSAAARRQEWPRRVARCVVRASKNSTQQGGISRGCQQAPGNMQQHMSDA